MVLNMSTIRIKTGMSRCDFIVALFSVAEVFNAFGDGTGKGNRVAKDAHDVSD